MAQPDLLILTAASEAQARGYRLQLELRRRCGALDPGVRTLVVPDTDGRRIGSGASTFLALRAAAQCLASADGGWPDRGADQPRCSQPGRSRLGRSQMGRSQMDRSQSDGGPFAGRNILIVHSGGDSRRLPAYAALGKVFVPLPLRRTGTVACLLDLIVEDLAGLFIESAGRVVVAAGDLVVGVGGAEVRCDADVVGLAVSRPKSVGTRHGVFVTDEDGRWLDFLQKPSIAQMAARGAIAGGRALVDSGVVSLSPHAAEAWLVAAGQSDQSDRSGRSDQSDQSGQSGTGLLDLIESGEAPLVDLYVHILSAFARRMDEPAYLAACGAAGAATPALMALRRSLRRLSARVAVLRRADFLHLGTSREYLEGLVDRGPERRFGFFAPASRLRGLSLRRWSSTGASEEGGAATGRRRAPSGASSAGVRQRGVRHWLPSADVVAESCGASIGLGSGPRPGGSNLLVGVPDGGRRWSLPNRWCAAILPVGRRAWTMLVHGLDDDFKTSIAADGTLGNIPLRRWRHLLSWLPHQSDQSLFDLPLWPIGSLAQVRRGAIWMARGPDERPPSAWRSMERASLRGLTTRIDQRRMIELRDAAMRADGRARLGEALDLAAAGAPTTAEIARLAESTSEVRELRRSLRACIAEAKRGADPEALRRAARAVLAEAALRVGRLDRDSSNRLGDGRGRARAAALSLVGRSVAAAIGTGGRGRARSAEPATGVAAGLVLRPNAQVRVRTPVRLDLAGGWTDTSPISEERGGAVVNVAVSLDGALPVEVVARVIEEPVVRLRSVDADRRVEIRDARALHRHTDPRDWSALGRAAVVLSGFAPPRPERSLASHLRAGGGGVEVVMRSGVPKGSGLGTSSILAATLLTALASLRGHRLSRSEVVRRTSLVEQMISTRGGWQDQVGGLVAGFKLATTRPGSGAVGSLPRIERLAMPRAAREELAARSILVFTGIRRMARGILENVVCRYLTGEREVINAVLRLRAGAAATAEAFEAGDVDAVAERFAEYWSLKKTMDPGSTTPAIEALMAPHERRLAAWGLTGAGGGGFALLIARTARDAERIRSGLARHAAEGVRVHALEIADNGMCVDRAGEGAHCLPDGHFPIYSSLPNRRPGRNPTGSAAGPTTSRV